MQQVFFNIKSSRHSKLFEPFLFKQNAETSLEDSKKSLSKTIQLLKLELRNNSAFDYNSES